jgi:tetracenomycin A2 monooxygenase-dioxygenase
LVIDKRDPTNAPPRAGASLRTLEILRSVGLGAAVQRSGWTAAAPMRVAIRDSAFGRTYQQTSMPAAYDRRVRDCSPVDARLDLTQLELQKIALDQLGDRVRLGVEMLDFSASADEVRVRVTDGSEEWEIVTSYLIGADGAGSDVRQRLGIKVPDREVITQLNTAFYRADLGPIMQEWGTHACFVRNDAVYATIFSKNGRDLWSSHIMDYPGKPDGRTELSAEHTIELLHAAIGDDSIPIELHAVTAWEAAIGMASSFRDGRIFLVGDAAHVQSSAGGLGMNTGVQDGHNLAWKIAAVLDKTADPGLLDTYEPERRSAAQRSLQLSYKMHRGYQAQESELHTEMADDYLHAMMFYGYQSAAILAEDIGEHDVFTDEVRTGYRLPHRWLAPGVSTVDLSEWTLFADSGWASTAAELGAKLRTALHPDRAILVRPDGFVCWQGLEWRPARREPPVRGKGKAHLS